MLRRPKARGCALNATVTSSRHQIYPDYCHSLSPTIGKWCPLRATDVHNLVDVGLFYDKRPLFHYGNHPVKWVRLTGVIVAVDNFSGSWGAKRIYTLDDSSGACIMCSAVAPPAPPKLTVEGPRHLVQLSALEEKADGRKAGQDPCKGASKNREKVKEMPTVSVRTPRIPWEEVDVGKVVKVKGRVDMYRDQMCLEIVKMDVLGCTDMEVKCWNEAREFRRDVLSQLWVLSKEDEERCRGRRLKEHSRATKEKRVRRGRV